MMTSWRGRVGSSMSELLTNTRRAVYAGVEGSFGSEPGVDEDALRLDAARARRGGHRQVRGVRERCAAVDDVDVLAIRQRAVVAFARGERSSFMSSTAAV